MGGGMAAADERIIGVLGGMGPFAGAWFAQRLVALTPADGDADHVPAVLVNDPRVPDRVGPIMGASGDSPAPAMIAGVRRLEAAGAGIVAIACNTAHNWYDEVAAAAAIPVLDMMAVAVDEAAGAAEAAGATEAAGAAEAVGAAEAAEAIDAAAGPIGVLATRGTIAAELYQRVLADRGLPFVLASDALNDASVLPAIAAVKAGRMAEAEAAARHAAAGMAAAGSATVILACTELSVCWPRDLRDAAVDASDALARAALRWAGVTPLGRARRISKPDRPDEVIVC